MERLIKVIDSKFEPLLVPVIPEKYSKINSCFYNVEDKINVDGGQIVYGWKLHQGLFLIEAERHAIWESSEGELVDVTPNIENSSHVLFVREDRGWTYNGRSEDNIRINITGDPLVDDYILLAETINKLYLTAKRESRDVLILLSPIANLIKHLEEDKKKRELYIYANNTVDSNCYCNSGIKYKDCHGNELKKAFDEAVSRATKIANLN